MPEFFAVRSARAGARVLAPHGLAPHVLLWAATLLTAGALLAGLTWRGVMPGTHVLAVWIALVTIAELWPVELPKGASLSVTPVLVWAALPLFGPAPAAWFLVLGVCLAQGVIGRRPTRRFLFTASRGVIAASVAAAAFWQCGGKVGSFIFPASVPAFLAAAATYFLVDTMLASAHLGVRKGRAVWRVWEANYRWCLPHTIALMPLAMFAVLVHDLWGAAAAVTALIPLYVARSAFQAQVDVVETLEDVSSAMIEVIGEVDPYTRRHSIRVAVYAEQLARELRLPESEVDRIRLSGLLHDVGKIGQERNLLTKPRQLTDGERQQMEVHPVAGARIVECVRHFGSIADIVRHHHERVDGRGYPDALIGETIPLGARVVLVADALDAMTSDRAYRRGMPLVVAVAELNRHRGGQFDANVVTALESLAEAGELRVLQGDVEHRLDRHGR